MKLSTYSHYILLLNYPLKSSKAWVTSLLKTYRLWSENFFFSFCLSTYSMRNLLKIPLTSTSSLIIFDKCFKLYCETFAWYLYI